MRQAASLLAVRARLVMAEGHLDQAARTLQTGLSLARQVGEAPSLIPALIGMAITAEMAQQIDQFVQCAQAPNLYWALTDLPQPFLGLREALQGERVAAYGTFPGLYQAATDRDAGALSPRQIETIIERLLASQKYGLVDFKTRADLDRALAAQHEAAKRALIAQGRPRRVVEKMPPVQVALLHSLAQHDRLFDDVVKWQNFPYWQAHPRLWELE
jgi:hypothetical protein